jgi:hypothetical protein
MDGPLPQPFAQESIAFSLSELRAALATADEYVWIYTEQPRWWTPVGTSTNLPTPISIHCAKSDRTTKFRSFGQLVSLFIFVILRLRLMPDRSHHHRVA